MANEPLHDERPAGAAPSNSLVRQELNPPKARTAAVTQWIEAKQAAATVEAAAFRELAGDVARIVRKLYPHMTPEDREDLEQEALRDLAVELPKFDPEKGKLSVWIYQIVRTSARRYWHRRSVAKRRPDPTSFRGPLSLDAAIADEATGSNLVARPDVDQLGEFVAWLEPLPTLERIAFYWKFVEGRSGEQIGELLGISRERVRQAFIERESQLGAWWLRTGRGERPRLLRPLRMKGEPKQVVPAEATA